jgi:hypothetical protein
MARSGGSNSSGSKNSSHCFDQSCISLQGAAGYRHTVKQRPTSPVREIRTLGSVEPEVGDYLRPPGGRSAMIVPTATVGTWTCRRLFGNLTTGQVGLTATSREAGVSSTWITSE